MSYYLPALRTDLVRDLLANLSTPSSPTYRQALQAVRADLARVDGELDRAQAEKDREEARKKPALTIQKVTGLLRRAKLQIASYDDRVGSSDGLSVTYGDYPRTWVKVSYSFAWNFGFNHSINPKAEHKAMVKLVEEQLLTSARATLAFANLQVGAFNDPNANPHLVYLKVTL